jgi:hypothetical protein
LVTDSPSPFLRIHFLAVGWTDRRSVDIKEWVEVLAGEGSRSNPLADEALRSFGGLRVEFPPLGNHSRTTWLVFDPFAARGECSLSREFQVQIGTSLFPIGVVPSSDWILWSGSNGEYYCGRDFGLFELGAPFGDAIEGWLITGRTLRQCAD